MKKYLLAGVLMTVFLIVSISGTALAQTAMSTSVYGGATQSATILPGSVCPKIYSISPTVASVGTTVTLKGCGFSATNNTIGMEVPSGAGIKQWGSLSSTDGTTLTFVVPASLTVNGEGGTTTVAVANGSSYNVTVSTTSAKTNTVSLNIGTTTSAGTVAPVSVQAGVIKPTSLGDTGANVGAVQSVLINSGYLNGTVTNIFDTKTQEAVSAFQNANGLSNVGNVGPKTSQILTQISQASTVTTSPVPPANTDNYTYTARGDVGMSISSAKLGDHGDHVLAIQKILKEKGYLTATPNGRFGPATYAAVRAFQKDKGIFAGGGVGPSTISALRDITERAIPLPLPATGTSGLLIARNMAYADQTVAPGTTHFKVGSYLITNLSSTEYVNLTNLNIGFTGLSSTTTSEVANISAQVAGVTVGTTVATLPSTYVVNIPVSSIGIAPSTTTSLPTIVDIYADVGTASVSSFRSNLMVSGTGTTSGTPYITWGGSSYSGQAIYIGTGIACAGTAPSVTVTSPNGGEVYAVGSVMHITWNTCNTPTTMTTQIGLRDSRYSPSLGSGEETIINTTNTGSYNWTVPASLSSLSMGTLGGASVYTVVIYTGPGGTGHFDESDAPFTITPSTSSCVVNTFIATPPTIPSGSSSTLSWTTTGCTSVVVSEPGFPFSAPSVLSGSAGTGPLYATSTFLITAAGPSSAMTRNVTVTVTGTTGSCTIPTFIATPSTIASGAMSMLSYTTTGCTGVSITGFGTGMALSSSGTSTGPLTATTTYTITATGPSSAMTRSVTVTVTGTTACAISTAPAVALKASLNSGTPVSSTIMIGTTNVDTLHFDLKNVTPCDISLATLAIGIGSNPGAGVGVSEGSYWMDQMNHALYYDSVGTLIATGSAENNVTPSYIIPAGTTKSFSVKYSVPATSIPGVILPRTTFLSELGYVKAYGTLSSGTYLINNTAGNITGLSVNGNYMTVDNSGTCVISALSASPSSVSSGGSSTISWSTTGCSSSLVLNTGTSSTPVPAVGSTTVGPLTSTSTVLLMGHAVTGDVPTIKSTNVFVP